MADQKLTRAAIEQLTQIADGNFGDTNQAMKVLAGSVLALTTNQYAEAVKEEIRQSATAHAAQAVPPAPAEPAKLEVESNAAAAEKETARTSARKSVRKAAKRKSGRRR